MEMIATAEVKRDEKPARDLRPGDWLAPPHLAEMLFVHNRRVRGTERTLLVYDDPDYLEPVVLRIAASTRFSLATADEIPADAVHGRTTAAVQPQSDTLVQALGRAAQAVAP